MKSTISLMALWIVGYSFLSAQMYQDYFGNGHSIGLVVTSSDTTHTDSARYTVDGTGNIPDLAGASRFLAQATLGYTYENIEYVTQIGIDAWIDEQFEAPDTSYLQAFYDNEGVVDLQDAKNQGKDLKVSGISPIFYEFVANRPDRLRQKLAFALSQILVTSSRASFFFNNGEIPMSYYEMLYQGAFGNYRDLLQKITLHPMMGIYLSSIRNQKADYGLNTRPDENFAREVMQLFTIGLIQLNNDGTPVFGEDGSVIPTYDNDDIEEMAKVFTGLYYSKQLNGADMTWNGVPWYQINRMSTMKMYPDFHDISPKEMIDGSVLPGGRGDLADINDALDLLFQHPNTGPFVSYRLIQHFVKSNPTPAYVNRVASVFNNNGQGTRGDMKAVIKAILMDPEARDCAWISHPENGKLIQPIERATHFFTAFDVYDGNGIYWYRDLNNSGNHLGQPFMRAPSVFNYFSPFYGEETQVKPQGLVSPEFEILNSVTAIQNLNLLERRAKGNPFGNAHSSGTTPPVDVSEEMNVLQTQGLSALIDRLDLLLCRGQLSSQTRSLITNTITEYRTKGFYNDDRTIEDAVYFIMASPDYLIQK